MDEEEPFAVSKPLMEYNDSRDPPSEYKDFQIVRAIFEHPACADVQMVCFPVGEHFGWNGLGRKVRLIGQDTKTPRLPDIPKEAVADDAFVVLVVDAATVRKLATTLAPSSSAEVLVPRQLQS